MERFGEPRAEEIPILLFLGGSQGSTKILETQRTHPVILRCVRKIFNTPPFEGRSLILPSLNVGK